MSKINLSDIANGLEKVRWLENWSFSACCPAHNDRTPSFRVTEVDGKILVKCFAGCSQDVVISELKGRGLWPDNRSYKCRVKKISKEVIWRHQMLLATELSRAEQGFSHTKEEQEQIKHSSQFLEAHGYGL